MRAEGCRLVVDVQRVHVVGVPVELEAGRRVSAWQGADRVVGMALDVHRGGESAATACSRVEHSLSVGARLWSEAEVDTLGW